MLYGEGQLLQLGQHKKEDLLLFVLLYKGLRPCLLKKSRLHVTQPRSSLAYTCPSGLVMYAGVPARGREAKLDLILDFLICAMV